MQSGEKTPDTVIPRSLSRAYKNVYRLKISKYRLNTDPNLKKYRPNAAFTLLKYRLKKIKENQTSPKRNAN